MKKGDTVKVYPHGSPQQLATGVVELISRNERSIAVVFHDKPPFAVDKSGGVPVYMGQVCMLATRAELNGQPWGPWVEMFGGGHYEIEEVLKV